MLRAQRQQSIDAFQTNDDITILLVSIKSGGTGLNLVAANHVLITDLWWNSAVEQQVGVGVCMYVYVYVSMCLSVVE